MRTPSTSSVVVLVTILVLCGLALLFAQGRILPQAFVGTPLEKPLADGCFRLSLPGLMVALTLHPSYRTKGTIVSDFIIVTVNTVIYAAPALLLLGFVKRRRATPNSRLAKHPYITH